MTTSAPVPRDIPNIAERKARTTLATLQSTKEQIWYACDQLTEPFKTSDVQAWLRTHGVESGSQHRSYVSTQIKHWRNARESNTVSRTEQLGAPQPNSRIFVSTTSSDSGTTVFTPTARIPPTQSPSQAAGAAAAPSAGSSPATSACASEAPERVTDPPTDGAIIHTHDATPESDPLADLEAELMQEIQLRRKRLHGTTASPHEEQVRRTPVLAGINEARHAGGVAADPPTTSAPLTPSSAPPDPVVPAAAPVGRSDGTRPDDRKSAPGETNAAAPPLRWKEPFQRSPLTAPRSRSSKRPKALRTPATSRRQPITNNGSQASEEQEGSTPTPEQPPSQAPAVIITNGGLTPADRTDPPPPASASRTQAGQVTAPPPELAPELAELVAKNRARLAWQNDPALTEALSEDEIEAEKDLAVRLRELDRDNRWEVAKKRKEAERAALDAALQIEARIREVDAEIQQLDLKDLVTARKALAEQRRLSSPHAKLADLYNDRRWLARAAYLVLAAGFSWSAVNVQHNIAPGLGPTDPLFWFSFLIEAMVSVCLVILMKGTLKLAEWKIEFKRYGVWTAEAVLLALTVALNTFPYFRNGDRYGIFVHAIAPIMIAVVLLIHHTMSELYGKATSIATSQLPVDPGPPLPTVHPLATPVTHSAPPAPNGLPTI
ncbi:hypothetical protein [Nocardia sp. NPDC052566]|uniref:hypothetical protein n=1 Tax=Nocardia sp. NPDC052566 TaxID=3364330 RepID=UPI0037C741BA